MQACNSALAHAGSCNSLCAWACAGACACKQPRLPFMCVVAAGEDQGDAHYLYENQTSFPFLRANNKAVSKAAAGGGGGAVPQQGRVVRWHQAGVCSMAWQVCAPAARLPAECAVARVRASRDFAGTTPCGEQAWHIPHACMHVLCFCFCPLGLTHAVCVHATCMLGLQEVRAWLESIIERSKQRAGLQGHLVLDTVPSDPNLIHLPKFVGHRCGRACCAHTRARVQTH